MRSVSAKSKICRISRPYAEPVDTVPLGILSCWVKKRNDVSTSTFACSHNLVSSFLRALEDYSQKSTIGTESYTWAVSVLRAWNVLHWLINQVPYSKAQSHFWYCQNMSPWGRPTTVAKSCKTFIYFTIPWWIKYVSRKSCTALLHPNQNKVAVCRPCQRWNHVRHLELLCRSQWFCLENLCKLNWNYVARNDLQWHQRPWLWQQGVRSVSIRLLHQCAQCCPRNSFWFFFYIYIKKLIEFKFENNYFAFVLVNILTM